MTKIIYLRNRLNRDDLIAVLPEYKWQVWAIKCVDGKKTDHRHSDEPHTIQINGTYYGVGAADVDESYENWPAFEEVTDMTGTDIGTLMALGAALQHWDVGNGIQETKG